MAETQDESADKQRDAEAASANTDKKQSRLARTRPSKPRRTRFRQAFISIASMVALIFTCVVGFGSEPQVPLVFGTLVAGLVAAWIGYSWDEMVEGMVDVVNGHFFGGLGKVISGYFANGRENKKYEKLLKEDK